MKDPLGFRGAGLLVQRLSIGGLMLFHGVHKIFNGIGGIEKMLEARDLPGFIAYGVYVGEVLGPLMMILGFKARIGAALVASTMVVSIFLAFSDQIFKLTENGQPALSFRRHRRHDLRCRHALDRQLPQVPQKVREEVQLREVRT